MLPSAHQAVVDQTQIHLLRSLLSEITQVQHASKTPLPTLFNLALCNRPRALSRDGYFSDHLPSSFASELPPRRRRLLVKGSVAWQTAAPQSLVLQSEMRQVSSILKEKVVGATPFVWVQRNYFAKDKDTPFLTDERCLAYPDVESAEEEGRRDYALWEGYKGCIVPGTLLATIASTHLESQLEPFQFIQTYSYNLVRPILVGNSELKKVWVEDSCGNLLMHATYKLGDMNTSNSI
ncbi:hypothetical protein BCR33DRAFT_715510 [Rhizoclosmatium globosum]|uniref:Uncharacterized protein n=1 Tax=Rhizoclosmatium globosum TaxID=329046 RepID=A0A1Y2CHW6_9FUNG|nr:hypothetical protein BCR33DRAFT_715510 [Rhizoclosmatium globosum]|eukprot:ORY46424.1 hypothetical protein BCR33DRAFT_715510 [Rhizoclosmatium globosum]